MNSKLKIVTLKKSYNIHDSALYKVRSLKHLAKVLLIDSDKLNNLNFFKDQYHIFTIKGKTGKEREIQNPIGLLAQVHSRIASLLCRINMPDYLHSGKKGRSNVTNAKCHAGENLQVLTVDLVDFYPSTNSEKIFKFFLCTMKCSYKIAKILTTLCSYNEKLPTGSQISMPLAYFANCMMFKEIENLSNKHTIKMSVYVDDITFSGEKITRLFYNLIKKIAIRHGHSLKHTKTKYYKKNSAKLITGVVIKDANLLVRNKHHQEIYQTKELLTVAMLSDTHEQIASLRQKLIGKLHACGSIDPKAKSEAYFYQRQSI
ncbi:reverse transcriptase family protein [Acinetobacter baumannii]|uniref:reverse transcriptase family protein n=1 Tax=Acinetobacter baumannii TaxID=470 RepID=UPI00186B91EC|nr:reverse transcriptase family protein [Acinetobacter baumannii]MBE4722850.1 RNA-directed DNA polymerase [Acinetobacter baumannii]